LRPEWCRDDGRDAEGIAESTSWLWDEQGIGRIVGRNGQEKMAHAGADLLVRAAERLLCGFGVTAFRRGGT
jgi:hypothetical protein